MIRASFSFDREEGWIALRVQGHAGFAQLGQDPVCAGASVLAFTAAQCLKDMESQGKLRKKLHLVARSGRMLLVAKPRDERFDEALHVLYMAETGMRLLAESWPEHVTVEPFDREETLTKEKEV